MVTTRNDLSEIESKAEVVETSVSPGLPSNVVEITLARQRRAERSEKRGEELAAECVRELGGRNSRQAQTTLLRLGRDSLKALCEAVENA